MSMCTYVVVGTRRTYICKVKFKYAVKRKVKGERERCGERMTVEEAAGTVEIMFPYQTTKVNEADVKPQEPCNKTTYLGERQKNIYIGNIWE